MPKSYIQSAGVSTYLNPLLSDGGLIHAVNVTSFPYGAKTKRTGYSTFLGKPDSAQVNSLFAFPLNDGSTFTLHRASGSSLYYSTQGTGAWTLASNGTIANGAYVGNAILNNTMIIGDGSTATRHTTDGQTFTNTSLAPLAASFEQYQERIYAAGTSSTLFYSTTNDATNWNTSGTSDSSSFIIPGQGKLGKIFKTADRLIPTKNSGLMHKWDGNSLIDMTTKYGPSSPYSVGEIEDYRFFINQFGHFGFGGARPQLLSNAIQRQFYNARNTGITPTLFPTIQGVCHKYDYFASVGTITDDFTNRTISNALIKYDYQKNEYLNWSLGTMPTSFLSYKDSSQNRQLLFGDAGGQVYQFDTSNTDNGKAIEAEMVFMFTYGDVDYDKKWNWLRLFFNPGCQAQIQVACADTYSYAGLKWIEVGDCSKGLVDFRFPAGSRSRLLFLRIYEASKNIGFSYYGCSIDAMSQTLI